MEWARQKLRGEKRYEVKKNISFRAELEAFESVAFEQLPRNTSLEYNHTIRKKAHVLAEGVCSYGEAETFAKKPTNTCVKGHLLPMT